MVLQLPDIWHPSQHITAVLWWASLPCAPIHMTTHRKLAFKTRRHTINFISKMPYIIGYIIQPKPHVVSLIFLSLIDRGAIRALAIGSTTKRGRRAAEIQLAVQSQSIALVASNWLKIERERGSMSTGISTHSRMKRVPESTSDFLFN